MWVDVILDWCQPRHDEEDLEGKDDGAENHEHKLEEPNGHNSRENLASESSVEYEDKALSKREHINLITKNVVGVTRSIYHSTYVPHDNLRDCWGCWGIHS